MILNRYNDGKLRMSSKRAVLKDRCLVEELLPQRDVSHGKQTIVLLPPVTFVKSRDKSSHKVAKSQEMATNIEKQTSPRFFSDFFTYKNQS